MQHCGEDFPPLRQNVTREPSTAGGAKSLQKGKKTGQKEITSALGKEISLEADKEDPIPSVYVASDILSSSTSSSPRKGFGYSINDEPFYDDANDTDEQYVEFEVIQLPEAPLSKMAAEYDMYCSDSDGETDGEDATPLQITYQQLPYGCIINSNVFLSTHQWHTLVSIDDKTILCAVCDLYTDFDTYKKHLERSAHECNLKKCPPLHKFDMSVTRKIKSIYHCGVCNELFRTSEREIHFNNKMHEGNLLFAINKATDIIFCDSQDNKENAHGIDNKKMSAENDEKDCYHFNANNVTNQREKKDDNRNDYRNDYNDNYEEDVNLKFINYENNFDYADEYEYEEPEVPIAGISYAKMAKTPKVEVQKFFEVDLGDNKVKVRYDSYHMIIISKKMKNEFWCMVCKMYDHMKNKFIHCQNPEHNNRLVTFRVVDRYQGYFIRQVDTKLFHCGHCNNLQMVTDMEDHIETVHPRRTRQTSETKHAVKDEKTVNKGKNPSLFKNLFKNDTNNMKTNENAKKYPTKPHDNNVGNQNISVKNYVNDNLKHLTNVNAVNYEVKPVIPNPNVTSKLTGPNVFKVTHTPSNAKAQTVTPVNNIQSNNIIKSQNVPRDYRGNEFSANINTQPPNASVIKDLMTVRDATRKIAAPGNTDCQISKVTGENIDAVTGRRATKKITAPVKTDDVTLKNNVMTNFNSQNSVMTNRNREVANFDNNTRLTANFDTNKLASQSVMTNSNVMTRSNASNFDKAKELINLENIAKNNQILRNMEKFKVSEEKIVIYPFGCKMSVPLLSYNVICMRPNDFYCGLCDILFAFDIIKQHICDITHIEFLQRTPFVEPFKYHLIRAIRDAFHCTICNCPITVDKIMQHPNDAIHTAVLMKYLKYKPEGVTCDLGFTGARETQGVKLGYAMSNDHENITNQPNMAQNDNTEKLPQIVSQKPILFEKIDWQYTSKNTSLATQNVSKVAQRVNAIAQEIPVYVPTNPACLPNYGLNNKETQESGASSGEPNYVPPSTTYMPPNTTYMPPCTTYMPPCTNDVPPNTNSVMKNTYEMSKNSHMYIEENHNTKHENVNLFNLTSNPSTWSYKVESDLIPEKLTRPFNTDNNNAEKLPVYTFTSNAKVHDKENERANVATEKTSSVKHNLRHEMAKKRYELQNALLGKTFTFKHFNATVTAPFMQKPNDNVSLNDENINEDQENLTNQNKQASKITAQQENVKGITQEEDNNTFGPNNCCNSYLAAKRVKPNMAQNPPSPIMDQKPPTPTMVAKPDTSKEMPFVVEDMFKPPPMNLFATKTNDHAPTQSELEEVAQNEETSLENSDEEENLEDEQEISGEEEYSSEDDDDECLDETMDKTLESQGSSDDACFDTEEYVYINLKNTYIKISNAAYNTLVHIGDGSRYCFVCSEEVDYYELQKHVDSRSHIEKMDGYRFLDKYEHHLLRQNFLNYHCAICNVVVTRKHLKSHIEWLPHIAQNENTFKNIKTLKEIKGGVKHVAVSTTKEIIYLNEHEPQINIFLNVKVTQKVNIDADYYEARTGNVTKSERLNKSEVINKLPKKEPKIVKPKRLNKLIFVCGSVLKVSWRNWHGVSLIKSGYKCNLCQRDLLESELDEHCASDWHSYSLKKEIEKAWLPALIRKVNESALNCVVCNTELPNRTHLVKEHVNGKKHVKNFDTLKCESERDDTYDDCDEDVFNAD